MTILWQIQWVRDLFLLLIGVCAIWLGYAMRDITIPLLVALLLAYLFEPLISYLANHSKFPLGGIPTNPKNGTAQRTPTPIPSKIAYGTPTINQPTANTVAMMKAITIRPRTKPATALSIFVNNSIGLLFLDQLGVPEAERMAWWGILIWPSLVFAFVQALDGWVLTPFIAGKATNLDPVTIFVAVIAGGSVLGAYGMLLAIPVAACIKILIQDRLLPKIQAWASGEADDPLPFDD